MPIMQKISNYLNYSKTILRSSYETALVNLYRSESRRHSEQDIENISLFFIFSLGRSGTQFLARMLNNDMAAAVLHEPAKRDVLEYNKSFSEGYNYSAYIKGFRKKFIQYNVANKNIHIYGEVNSYLRRHASTIMECIPGARCLFLIRDGRDVVRSMMSRDIFSDNWLYNSITPAQDDPYYSKWSEWGPFEKSCWLWASENALLYNQFGEAFKFEKIISDYSYFKANVIGPIQVAISESTWANEIRVKSENRTLQYKIDPYETWSKEWKRIFWEICGKMMETHGYK